MVCGTVVVPSRQSAHDGRMARRPGPAPRLPSVPGRAQADVTPMPKTRRAEPPAWLSVRQRAVWDRVVVELAGIHGQAFRADTDVIVAYVTAVDAMANASKELTRLGPLVTGRDGGTVRNPAAIVHSQYAALVDRLATSLGLTPDARSRMRRTADTEAARSGVLSLEDFFANGPA